jgi:uncharacterized protein (TIGR02145 family)
MIKINLKTMLSLFIAMLFAQINYGQTVTIGTQVWATKNLDVSFFRNGDPIPEAKTDEEWLAAGRKEQPAWCYYNNDPANGEKYGKLYNWYAVNDPRGLAPEGYHIPTYAEWKTLKNYLGNDAYKKMRSTSGWNSYTTGGSKTCPNCEDWSAEYRKKVPCHTCKDTRSVKAPTKTQSANGTNESGFSGLPGGYRERYLSFQGIGAAVNWWTSTENDNGRSSALAFFGLSNWKLDMLYVRCLWDDEETSYLNEDNSSFNVVTNGKQVWMTKNLNVDKFRNGDPIPEAKTNQEWLAALNKRQPAWCYYDNDPANGEKYGKLYNWYAVNDPRGLAPEGYHIPSNEEWTIFEKYLGEEPGWKMKSTSGWNDYDLELGNGSNSSGFSGLPGGYRGTNGIFYYIGYHGNWWNSSEYYFTNSKGSWGRYLSNHSGDAFRVREPFIEIDPSGMSVRCLRD